MLNEITIGQYFPTGSPLHRLDPRLKLTATLLFVVLIFLSGNIAAMAASILATAALAAVSRVSARTYLRTVKAVLPVILLTSFLNAFYTKGAQPIFEFWIFALSYEGILRAVYMSVRIILMIAVSGMLTYTTSPTELTGAIEQQFSFLRVFRLQNAVHTMAMMMTIALRFIPTLLEETDKIMNAQKARGANLDTGGLIKRVRAMLPILIPLLVSSVRRAIELADAMESRCYTGGEGRTRMKVLRFSRLDYLSAAVFAGFAAAVLLLNYLLPVLVKLPL